MHSWKQKDIPLFLILVPVFTVIDYFIVYSRLDYNINLLIAFAIDSLQGYLIWLVMRFIIIQLEKRYPLENFSKRRIAAQVLLTCAAGVAIAMTIPDGSSFRSGEKYAEQSPFLRDLIIFLVWLFITNAVYIGMQYFYIWKKSEILLREQQALKTKVFTVKIGDKNIRIPLKDIRGFFIEDSCTYVIDADFKTYIADSSLDNIEQQLPPQFFFRVNRKFILHRNSITSFKRVEDNKLVIFTLSQKPMPGELPMSRLKAPAFKKWFEQDAVGI